MLPKAGGLTLSDITFPRHVFDITPSQSASFIFHGK